MQMQKIV